MVSKRREIVDEVIDRINYLDIEEVISYYLEIKKSGMSYTAICPFHNDNRAGNFYIHKSNNSYKCFACGAGGDAIDFVQGYEGVSFLDAIATLGLRYGYITFDEYEKYFNPNKTRKQNMKKIRKRKPIKKKVVKESIVQRASDKTIHIIYSSFIDVLRLSKEDLKYLREERLLSYKEIISTKYRSLDEKVNKKFVLDILISKIESRGLSKNDLLGVPGFFVKGEEISFDNSKGLLIPVRNPEGLIVGLQIRNMSNDDGPKYTWFSSSFAAKDEGFMKYGVAAGQPIDVVYPVKKKFRKAIFITEGKFKAEKIANEWGYVTISIQGVNNWGGIEDYIERIEKRINHKFEIVFTAFDADASFKFQVFEQLKKMTDKILENKKVNIKYLSWDHRYGKGIDDLMINNPDLKEKKLVSINSKDKIDNIYEKSLKEAMKLNKRKNMNMDKNKIKSIAVQNIAIAN